MGLVFANSWFSNGAVGLLDWWSRGDARGMNDVPWRNQCLRPSHGNIDGRCSDHTCEWDQLCACRHGCRIIPLAVSSIFSMTPRALFLHHSAPPPAPSSSSKYRETQWNNVPSASTLSVGSGTRVPDRLVRHGGRFLPLMFLNLCCWDIVNSLL